MLPRSIRPMVVLAAMVVMTLTIVVQAAPIGPRDPLDGLELEGLRLSEGRFDDLGPTRPRLDLSEFSPEQQDVIVKDYQGKRKQMTNPNFRRSVQMADLYEKYPPGKRPRLRTYINLQQELVAYENDLVQKYRQQNLDMEAARLRQVLDVEIGNMQRCLKKERPSDDLQMCKARLRYLGTLVDRIAEARAAEKKAETRLNPPPKKGGGDGGGRGNTYRSTRLESVDPVSENRVPGGFSRQAMFKAVSNRLTPVLSAVNKALPDQAPVTGGWSASPLTRALATS